MPSSSPRNKPLPPGPQDDVPKLPNPSPLHAIRTGNSAVDRFPNRKPPWSGSFAAAEWCRPFLGLSPTALMPLTEPLEK